LKLGSGVILGHYIYKQIKQEKAPKNVTQLTKNNFGYTMQKKKKNEKK
jgi:hypothetical protein